MGSASSSAVSPTTTAETQALLRYTKPRLPAMARFRRLFAVRRVFAGADPRVCTAFWLFVEKKYCYEHSGLTRASVTPPGIVNNLPYIITLAAALDIVGPSVPKATILLANVLPSLLCKLLASSLLHLIPYPALIIALTLLSTLGTLTVASASSLPVRFAGIALTSAASGVGEVACLGMTQYYGRFAIAFWSSGTGAASLLGAALYNVLTTGLGWRERRVLAVAALVPLLLAWGFFGVLPRAALQGRQARRSARSLELQLEPELVSRPRQAAKLFFPYILPLMLVYIAEYTINQGVAPTLLFPPSTTPFTHIRAIYPAYNLLYQLGVFISRSSTPWLRLHRQHLYLPAILQLSTLLFLILQSLHAFIPSIWLVFAIIFAEGLVGGLAYVNTFAAILEDADILGGGAKEREFAMGAVSVGDTAGICIAGLASLALEPALCAAQVRRGVEWCRMM
ncbi:CLN3 protein-domain-containing protein [Geopyxis carbonaria]|nr:CLN3 protein-domain-containing protein [Geopyxis carbonaria]